MLPTIHEIVEPPQHRIRHHDGSTHDYSKLRKEHETIANVPETRLKTRPRERNMECTLDSNCARPTASASRFPEAISDSPSSLRSCR